MPIHISPNPFESLARTLFRAKNKTTRHVDVGMVEAIFYSFHVFLGSCVPGCALFPEMSIFSFFVFSAIPLETTLGNIMLVMLVCTLRSYPVSSSIPTVRGKNQQAHVHVLAYNSTTTPRELNSTLATLDRTNYKQQSCN